MALKTKKHQNTTIIYLEGRLDIVMADEIRSELNSLIEGNNNDLLINLKDIEYVSSTGLRLFISAKGELEKQNRRFMICYAKKVVHKILAAIELVDFFDMHETEEQALKSS